MEHAERRRWCEKISAINEAMNANDGTNASRPIDMVALR
jgi:hypothetical protein